MGYDSYLLNLAKSLRISKKILFTGKVDGVDKERLLSSSYALILPSFSENFGAVVAESLAQGTPCIASKGTPWEILEDFKAGLHVPNDPLSLSKAIDALIMIDQNEYLQMRENARYLAEEVLDIDINTDKWINLINS